MLSRVFPACFVEKVGAILKMKVLFLDEVMRVETFHIVWSMGGG